MEFRILYYTERLNLIDHNNPKHINDKINIINPEGYSGIVTLWTKPGDIWKRLLERFPRLFQKDSPLVTLTSLYGNGLPQMLANLAYNPQIENLAITGNDTKVVPSSTYLLNFLKDGVENGEPFGKIKNTTFPIDPQLKPEIFRHLKVQRFAPSNLEGLVNFVIQEKITHPQESERIEIKLIEPEFSDYPSDITRHQVYAETPLEAWIEVMFRLDRFGNNIQLAKGKRRALFNLDVHITNPAPEGKEILRKFNFDPEELLSYREDMLKGELPDGVTYTYGNRIRKYFGVDTLEKVIERFKEDAFDRSGFISLWDNKEDLVSDLSSDSSVPCLTDLYFVNLDGKLMLSANFRTHNAVSAWLLNLYGLRAIQEYIAENVKLEAGKINVKSRWIGIDPDDGKTNSVLDLVKKHRKKRINVNDPCGYFVIGVKDEKIFTEHYTPDAQKLKTYFGKSAKDIKDQLRHDSAISDSDHAMWIGYELAKAHYELYKEIPEF